jgi:hypothetical protein
MIQDDVGGHLDRPRGGARWAVNNTVFAAFVGWTPSCANQLQSGSGQCRLRPAARDVAPRRSVHFSDDRSDLVSLKEVKLPA